MKRRCAFLTMEDLTGFFAYDSLTYGPLSELGWQVDEVPWTRMGVDWRQYEAVVIRSTWDYQQQPELFLQTLELIEASGTKLFNPLEVCRWNLNKSYLRDLERKGVPIIPTLWCESPSSWEIASWAQQLHSDQLVIKPLVGANADDTFVISAQETQGLAKLAEIFRTKPFMVQPFVSSIQTAGENSLFYFGGEYSHAVNKRPKQGDFRVQEEHGGQVQAVEVDERLMQAGQFVVDQLGERLLYARVDFVEWEGTPTLIEVELIEPSLYFSFDPAAAARFALALDRLLQPMSLPTRSIPPRR